MANVKNYGLVGVNRSLQLGKQGPKILGNADSDTFVFTAEDGATLTRVSGANAVSASDMVTKAQLDAVQSGTASDGFELNLGDISSNGDGSWTDGAVQSLTNTTKVAEGIDKLNEALENVRNNTFVKSVDAATDVAAGGAPLTATLTLTTVGNPNRYTIDWGDGTTDTATSDNTPSHTYTDNTNSPFDVTVTAFNNGGSGEGSSASVTKNNLITLYTADPNAAFAIYSGSAGGSAITFIDDGTSVYFDNDTTNIGSASASYTIAWGDGSSNDTISADTDAGGTQGARLAHTFTTQTEEDKAYTVQLTLDSHSTADPSVIPDSASAVFKVYDTHTPTVSINDTSGINEVATSGHVVTATNSTENTIGSYADFGIQYRYVWGDGQTDTVNVGSGGAGDTAGTINHTYALSATQQANGTAVDYVGNLEVISNHTSSPFKSSNFTVHVEPDVRGLFTGSGANTSLATGDNIRTVYVGTDLYGNNRGIVTVQNTSQNASNYEYDFGDAAANVSVTESGNGAGSTSANITHTYTSAGSYTMTVQSTGTPDITAQTDTDTINFTAEDPPAAPSGLSSQTLSLNTAYQGNSPKLAHGFEDNTGSESSPSAGDALTSSSKRRYATTTSISTQTVNNVYRSDTGTLTANWNGSADGAKTFTLALNETVTDSSLVVSGEGDAHDQINGSTYPPGFYQVFDAKFEKNISSEHHGAHIAKLSHSSTGNTNSVYIIKDNLTATPTINMGSATLVEETAGTKRYVSGIPYYNSGSPQVKLQGATVSNWIGQCYRDTAQVWYNASGTNYESTSGSAIQEEYRAYADVDGSSSMMNSGVPTANVGISSPYALGDIVVDITTNNSRKTVETIKFQMQNVNGTGSYSAETSEKIQVWTATPTLLDTDTIAVSDSLGATHDDDAVRITGFGSASDTPAFNSATNYYTGSAWSGAVTVAGTSEAITRLGTLQHNTTDFSTGFLPVGPDLNTGRSGSQYATFAFRRTTMSNFTVRLTGKVSGFFIAAPGTDIDDASSVNGWLDAGTTYAGAGTPGADTSNGGNGSNGCAFTSGDRIIDNTTYSNDTFTLTLGDQNASNSTGNQVLIRVKLESGDSITALSIE